MDDDCCCLKKTLKEGTFMATTRLISLHTGKGRTVAAALQDSVNYVGNPEKTNEGELVTSYACDPRTTDAEFLRAKWQYQTITGRVQRRDKNVLAYHQLLQTLKGTPQGGLCKAYIIHFGLNRWRGSKTFR
jgi:hypothetical protein